MHANIAFEFEFFPPLLLALDSAALVVLKKLTVDRTRKVHDKCVGVAAVVELYYTDVLNMAVVDMVMIFHSSYYLVQQNSLLSIYKFFTH